MRGRSGKTRRGLFILAVAAMFGGGCSDLRDSRDANLAPGAPGEGFAACVIAADCGLSAVDCCSCPTLAISAESAAIAGEECSTVGCGTPADCPAIEAACLEGGCVLRCSETVATQLCAEGYATDAAGCLVDACATAGGECAVPGDCARVPDDCCGCSLGGADTAVPGTGVDEHEDSLGCPPAPACPGVDVCNPDAAVACVAGSCALLPPPPLGSSYCGAEFGACPVGSECVLNDTRLPEAADYQVGLCREL